MSSNSTEAIEGSGCRHVIIRLDNGRVCRLVPSAEQLIEVSDAAINLVDAAQKSFCISGQDDPFSFPHYVRPRQIPFAILRLERVLNPRCLAFDDPLRPRIMTHGWPVDVADGLGWLRRLHDEVLVAWNVEALCGTKCVLLLQSRLVAPHQIDRNGKTIKASWWVDFQRLFDSKSHDGVVQIEMPQDWPPKIDRAILESMGIAASWIKEAVEYERLSGGSAAVAEKWSPPKGYVFAGAIPRSDGGVVPRTTVQGWAEKDKPKMERDPKTGTIYYEESWVKGRLKKYRQRPQ